MAGKITALQAALHNPILFVVGFWTKTNSLARINRSRGCGQRTPLLNPTYISAPSRQ